jgi:hypothetical protein
MQYNAMYPMSLRKVLKLLDTIKEIKFRIKNQLYVCDFKMYSISSLEQNWVEK